MRATRVVGALSCILTFAAAVADCSAGNVGVEPPADPLYGFADLHAHLAFHLAYGAGLDDAGNVTSNGIMYGLPGTSLDVDSAAADLAPCDGLAHGNDGVIANVLVTELANVLKTPHGVSGYPDFDNWPLATTGLHQQMHVTWLRHSYEGGQRLMVASVVENSTLAAAFLGNLSSPGSVAIHQAEQRVAEAQVRFIDAFVADNTDWLAIAKTPDEAEAAIRANKMAIVLGTEFDSLDLQEVNDLYGMGVRVFIPIHLADNDLGGTAVYQDAFNIHNAYMRDVGYAVQHDENVTFKLGIDIPPTQILGVPLPNPFVDANTSVPPGHRNVKGLYGADGADGGDGSTLGVSTIGQMMDLGVIIDVAHMSQQSTDDTIAIAVQKGGVPLIDSHTGVRARYGKAASERDLMFLQAQRIGALGGMIGLGTGGITAKYNDPVTSGLFYTSPTPSPFTLTPTTSSVSADVMQAPSAPCKGLSLEIATGDDDLRENSTANAVVTTYADPNHALSTTLNLNQHQLIGNKSTQKWMIPLTTDATTTNQFDFALNLTTKDSSLFQWSDDDWALSEVKLSCGPRSVHTDFDASNGPYALDATNTDPTPVGALVVDVWSRSALGCSNCAVVVVALQDGSSRTPSCTHGPLASQSIGHIACQLDSLVPASQIKSVTLTPPASDKSWTVTAGTVGFVDDTAPAVLIDNHSPPKLHGNDSTVVASRAFDGHSIRITLTTDPSGLDAGVDATATFVFGDHSTQTVRLNRRAALTAGAMPFGFVLPVSTTYQFYAVLANHNAGDIQSFRIDAPNLTRTWTITSVILEAFEDPVSAWVSELENVMSALGRGATDGGVGANCFLDGNRCGVGLGTDLNGMAPNIPGTTVSPYDQSQPDARVLVYPDELRYPLGVPAGGFHTGNKAWDVTTDGIAQVGLLPDFLVAAARANPDGGTARSVATVFHSAGDFVRMWKTIERFKKN